MDSLNMNFNYQMINKEIIWRILGKINSFKVNRKAKTKLTIQMLYHKIKRHQICLTKYIINKVRFRILMIVILIFLNFKMYNSL